MTEVLKHVRWKTSNYWKKCQLLVSSPCLFFLKNWFFVDNLKKPEYITKASQSSVVNIYLKEVLKRISHAWQRVPVYRFVAWSHWITLSWHLPNTVTMTIFGVGLTQFRHYEIRLCSVRRRTGVKVQSVQWRTDICYRRIAIREYSSK